MTLPAAGERCGELAVAQRADHDGAMTSSKGDLGGSSPVDDLGILAGQHVELAPGLEAHEYYTSAGLLALHWYGSDGSEPAVVMGGGAMGGMLGGAGLYHELGTRLAADGIAAASVGWRVPNHLDLCTHDLLATMQLMARRGARRFVSIGHSFGGAIAIRAAASLPTAMAPGVVTLATQSAGCEPAESLGDRELLFFHGDNDQILPHFASEMVRMLAGTGELVILPGEDHLLGGAKDLIIERLLTWIPQVLTV